MTGEGNGTPTVADVMTALGDAAKTLGLYVTHAVDEHPAITVAASLSAGFVVGGGLMSRLGGRLIAATARATTGNVATLITLDLVRRALEEGVPSGTQSTPPR